MYLGTIINPPGRYRNYCGSVPSVHAGTVDTVFTGPILSGYLTRISETRIVKLR